MPWTFGMTLLKLHLMRLFLSFLPRVRPLCPLLWSSDPSPALFLCLALRFCLSQGRQALAGVTETLRQAGPARAQTQSCRKWPRGCLPGSQTWCRGRPLVCILATGHLLSLCVKQLLSQPASQTDRHPCLPNVFLCLRR